MKKTEAGWLWFCSIPGFYRRNLAELLEIFHTPEELRESKDQEILKLPLKEEQKTRLLKWKKEVSEEELYHNLEKRGIGFISHVQEEFPEAVKNLLDYPYGLFYLGKLPQKGERLAAVVGARRCTNYGRKTAAELGEWMASYGISLVSGMACGIDGIAQSACLKAGGVSYAVVGCGVDICYPREHMQLYRELVGQGGIFSEFPPGTSPLPFHFPMRNRLISALAEKVIVVEARKRSGSLITADLALEQGKDVLAIPGRLGDPLSEGCNHLISQGAGILADMEELFFQFGITEKRKAPPVEKMKKKNIPLATSENMVYICLDFQPISLTELIQKSKLPPQTVMSALTGLQIKDLAEETGKNYYALKR